MAALQSIMSMIPNGITDRLKGSGGAATKAATIIMVGFALSQAIRLGNNLIMTRILLPADFGLMAIVNALPVIIAMFTDFGIASNVVASDRGENRKFLRTAWTIQVLRSFLMFAIVLLIAFGIGVAGNYNLFKPGTLYVDERFVPILTVSALAILFDGFSSIGNHVARRNLKTGRIVFLEIIAQVIAIPVMVILGIMYQSVWALVAGVLVAALTRGVLSHVVFPGFFYKFGFDKNSFWEIFHYGKWLVVNSMCGSIARQSDKFIVGGMIPIGVFGIYSIAGMWVMAINTAFSRVLIMVAFPYFSNTRRENIERVTKNYYKYRLIADSFMVLAVCGLLFIALIGIPFLFQAEYGEVSLFMILFAMFLPSNSFTSLEGLFLAHNDSRTPSEASVMQAVTLIVSIFIGFEFGGIQLVAFLVSINPLISLPWMLYRARKFLKVNYLRELAVLPICAALIFAAYSFYV